MNRLTSLLGVTVVLIGFGCDGQDDIVRDAFITVAVELEGVVTNESGEPIPDVVVYGVPELECDGRLRTEIELPPSDVAGRFRGEVVALTGGGPRSDVACLVVLARPGEASQYDSTSARLDSVVYRTSDPLNVVSVRLVLPDK